MRAFGHPVPQAIVVPRLGFADIAPSVSPVVHCVRDVGCYKVHVAEVLSTFLQFNEIVGGGIPVCVDCL